MKSKRSPFLTEDHQRKFEDHKRKWNICQQCAIGRHDCRVYFRGVIPANILIVGEAPGDTEAVLREPFVGPSGKLLDDLIKEAYGSPPYSLLPRKLGGTICITNSILCVPMGDTTTSYRLRAPTGDELLNCAPRLREFVQIVNPKVIVAAGKVSEKAVLLQINRRDAPPYVTMPHPASILRQGERGGLDRARAIEALREAARKFNVF